LLIAKALGQRTQFFEVEGYRVSSSATRANYFAEATVKLARG